LQQNHNRKGEGCHFLAAKPSKKVATTIVLFFNTNLLPSLLCYKGKIKGKTKEEGAASEEEKKVDGLRCSVAPQQKEEGNDNCRRLLRGAAL
jgi:hypothetical protein